MGLPVDGAVWRWTMRWQARAHAGRWWRDSGFIPMAVSHHAGAEVQQPRSGGHRRTDHVGDADAPRSLPCRAAGSKRGADAEELLTFYEAKVDHPP